MDNFDIFISYSSKDKPVADQLVTHIEKAGYTCWIAPRNIVAGVEYSEVIEKAILKCKVFLIIFSEYSEKSSWVKSELNIAFSENKYLIPYKIDATPLKGTMRLLLNDKHWIEKGEGEAENKQLNLLVSAIKKYFDLLEKGGTDELHDNPYYTNIAKNTKRKKLILIFSLVGLAILVGLGVFLTTSFSRNQKIKNYHDLVEQAIALSDTSITDMVNKKKFLEQARALENEIPASKQKNFSEILSGIKIKLDSIYSRNLDDARIFAETETKNGDRQAIDRFKIALDIKDDPTVRDELNNILSRQWMYE